MIVNNMIEYTIKVNMIEILGGSFPVCKYQYICRIKFDMLMLTGV